MNRTIEDIQKDIELLGIKGGYDIEQLLTPQDCRRLSYEIERLNNIIEEVREYLTDEGVCILNKGKKENERLVWTWENYYDLLEILKGSDKE